jgi:hypothetical protein
VKVAVAVVAPMICALGVLGGIGSFATVRRLAEPWFGSSAWIVPVGIDIGVVALLAWDLLTEYLGLTWPVLRWTAWAFIGATTYLNIAAARGDPTAAIMHAAMPVLFITVVEGIRHLIRQITGLAAGTKIERVPLSRWLCAPRSTALLARRMILWHVTSYRDGLSLEYQRLAAVSRLQEQYGRWLWRWKAPLRERLALRLASGAAVPSFGSSAPECLPAAPLPYSVPGPDPAAPTETVAPFNDHETKLIDAAVAILLDADEQGAELSQAALARQLRGRGLSIPNQRLRWLTVTARNRLPAEKPELPGGSHDGGRRADSSGPVPWSRTYLHPGASSRDSSEPWARRDDGMRAEDACLPEADPFPHQRPPAHLHAG